MRPSRTTAVLFALLLAPGGLPAAEPVERALAAWRDALPALRIEEADLALPSAPPPFHALSTVETLFSTPLAFPPAAASWLDSVETAAGLADLHRAASELLALSVPRLPAPPAARPRPGVPAAVGEAASTLIAAISAARPRLDAARASLTPEQRAAFAGLFGWSENSASAEYELSTRRLRRRLESLQGYQDREMQAAGGLILTAVDAAIAGLQARPAVVRRRVRWSTPAGDVLIGRSGNDVYRTKDLAGVVVLIEPGGDNQYEGPVAFAGPGEARVVIDMGANVLLNGSKESPPTAGASFFGVAVFALPNPAGFKRITTGDFSQGATIGGVAAMLVRGDCDLYAGRTSQGAGAAGAGIFVGEGEGARYESLGSGQGAGFTRGVGIFRHRGDDAILRGGLVEPDPREPQGSVSLCQGVGVGRRAFSGGGIGLCSLSGDGIRSMASYFAQGSGYWHAAGAFRIRGNRNTVQGRRYALGAGTHSAFGHFEALGDGNRLMNWGVGPSFGWDRGVGAAIVSGDGVEVQADWGVGTAEIGSRAFGYFDGKNGRLKVPSIGRGQWFRNESAYSLQALAGGPHRVQNIGTVEKRVSGRLTETLWGVLDVNDATLVRDLALKPPVWPEFKRDAATKKQAVDLQRELDEANGLGPVERVAAIADVAAAFSLDKATPRRALQRLLSLPPADVPHLAAALEPAAIEQLIQLSIALAAHGDDAARALAAVTGGVAHRRLAVHLLRLARPTIALAPLETALAGGGETSAAAARSLGALLNRDTGAEPGARAVLEYLAATIEKPRQAIRKQTLTLLSRLRLTDAFGLLAVAVPLVPADRLAFLSAGPEDVTEKIGAGGAEAFLKIVESSPQAGARIAGELAALASAETRLRPAFEALARSTETSAVQAAAIAAGQVGNGADARWVAPLVEHARASVRESAAVALGRMGAGGAPALLRLARSGSTRTRAMAAVGAAHGTDASAARVIEILINDRDPMVAAAAMAAVRFPPDALGRSVPALKKKAARRLFKAASRDLDINIRLLLLP